ncbi:germination protein YpeB [Anoxybacter fermentans]|uniref:Germination protein YpeB n=2 Tax=Anoxybacter fermentans TaxID=1323375 RepID=A0A3S9T2X3_9FIRM|nr:germination protein YpeB [Anoxybacter fermentans]
MAFLLLVTGFWGYEQYKERQQLEIYLGNQYKESFFKLLDRIEDVTVLLGKSIVSNGQQRFVTLLSDIWRQAFAAQEQLNQLPISNATLMKTSKFLTQVGDYALALAKENLQERKVTDDQRAKLKSLREQAGNLSQALHNLESQINKGDITWSEVIRGTRRKIEKADEHLLSNNFKTLVEKNEPFPTLIYDGPFSDHIEQQKPKGLTGDMISKKKAREIVSDFVDYKDNPNLVIKDLAEVKGKIPAYQFSVQPDDNEKNHTTIDVSKKGGHVIWYMNPRNVGSRNISRIEALNKGEQFLNTRGYENMVPTYSWIEHNVLTVSYAYKQDDVIIYPDLIKLKIAMDNGQVIGFEALGYLMSHHKRELPKPEIKKEEIRELLGDRFDIESIRLALIPTPSLKEVLTWEARVRYEEETYLLYYDVKSGNEVNILKVIDTPEGTFTD